LVQQCTNPQDTDEKPQIVCKTWYETYCNTTLVKEDAGNNQVRPHTWCDKVPKKICAPDYCQMIPGNQDCQEVTIQSTQVAPKEICDLQPTSDCHMETNLVPSLAQVQNCAEVPKEFCHMRMGEPKRVKKYVNMRWCWRGPEPTGWPVGQDGLSPTSANINPEFNTEIHPADNGVELKVVPQSLPPFTSDEGTTPTLNADGTSNRAEANPNPFASNLFQDPPAVENTPNLPVNAGGIADLLNSAIQPTGQNLRTG